MKFLPHSYFLSTNSFLQAQLNSLFSDSYVLRTIPCNTLLIDAGRLYYSQYFITLPHSHSWRQFSQGFQDVLQPSTRPGCPT
jgi:hypothetical protein